MMRRPRAKSILIIAAVLLALALPLMFLLEDFVRDAILMPLAYQAWLVGVVLGALPEGCLLMPVVGLAAYLAVRSLQRSRGTPPSVRTVPRRAPIGATRVWLERIEHVSAGTYSRERMEHYVGQLLMDVVSYENRLPPREALARIESGEIVVPDSVRTYVDAAFQSGVVPRRSWPARLYSRALRLLKGQKATGVPLDELTARVDPALAFIEEELRMEQLEAKE